MNITPSDWEACLFPAVAREIAKRIHGLVVNMHLRRTDCGHDSEERRKLDRRVVASIRKVLRTCEPHERRQWISMIRDYFHQLREENRTDPRWQDYVERVKKARGGAL